MQSKTADAEKKKLTYEQLEQVANQLAQRLRQTEERLHEASNQNGFRVLDYLFAVVHDDNKFSSEFAKRCADEIEKVITRMVTPPVESAKPEESVKE